MQGDVVYYCKALHIVFAVLWFAGLFCVVRLLMQQKKTLGSSGDAVTEPMQHLARRVWLYVAWPSAVLTLIFGGAIMHMFLRSPWFQLKIGLLLLLYACHVVCHQKYRQFQRGLQQHGSRHLRALSESINLLLFAVVSVAVCKDITRFMQLLLGAFVLGCFIFVAVRVYTSRGTKGSS